jgi:hypothetical protein
VYSFGVLLLELLTGIESSRPSAPWRPAS